MSGMAGESDRALERLDTAEKRLAALHELGVDTAALRSQVAFARTRLLEGHAHDAETLADEVLTAARRLAEGTTQPEDRPRTGRFSRDQLSDEVRAVLTGGLLAKAIAELRNGPDPRLEARLAAIDQVVTSRVEQVLSSARSELAVLNAEVQHLRQRLDQAADFSPLTAAIEHGMAKLAEAVVRPPPQSDPRQSTTGDGSRVALALKPGTAAIHAALVPEQETTRTYQQESTRSERAVPSESRLDTAQLRRLVADEVGQRLEDQRASEPMMVFDPDQVRTLVSDEVARHLSARASEPAPSPVSAQQNDDELRQALTRILPDLLRQDPVRQQLFALLAVEATAHPGALAELTGLRAFLRRELKLAADELAKDFQPS